MQELWSTRTPDPTIGAQPRTTPRRDRHVQGRPWRSYSLRPQIRVSAEQVLTEEYSYFGAVFVISLDEIFRALGGRSERLVEALRFMGESLLRMRLGPDDRFSYDEAGRFRIRFGRRNSRSAREAVEMLVDELGRRAIGTRFITWELIREDSEIQTA